MSHRHEHHHHDHAGRPHVHGHGHGHAHAHGGHHLNAALALTALFAVVELTGGLIAGSLALLADAVHMISDVAALAVAALAARIAARPAHEGMTYGYGRARILAAQLNAVALCFLAGWIVWEAVGRIVTPPQVDGQVMSAIAFIGLLVNLIVLKWLHGGEDLNSKAAYWHVLGDALGSVAALIGGAVILATGWMLIDPLLSFLVSGLLAWGGWRLIRLTTAELMEAVPEGVNRDEIIDAAREIDGVCDMHHVHIWKLPSGKLAMSAHVECKEMNNWSNILKQLHDAVAVFGITHGTFQPEEGPCHTKASTHH